MSNSFSENDIRPEQFEDEKNKTIIRDLDRLLSKRNEFIVVNCPACDSFDYKKEFEKNSLDYCRCNECETLFINPRPTPDILDWFYRNSEVYTFWNKYIFPASEKVRREKIFIPRVNKVLEFCEKFKTPQDSLIEIGSGYGTFCQELKTRNRFNKVTGVEPTPELAATCRYKGIDTIESTIENIKFSEEEKFDVAVSFEVIEHLFSPKDFVSSCSSILKPGGLLILTCPNIKGFDNLVLGPSSSTIAYGHLNYFNPASLSGMLGNSGFEVIETLTPGQLDADIVRNQVLKGNFSLDDQPFLFQVLIEKWDKLGAAFQQFLSDNSLSGHLWVVAKKL